MIPAPNFFPFSFDVREEKLPPNGIKTKLSIGRIEDAGMLLNRGATHENQSPPLTIQYDGKLYPIESTPALVDFIQNEDSHMLPKKMYMSYLHGDQINVRIIAHRDGESVIGAPYADFKITDQELTDKILDNTLEDLKSIHLTKYIYGCHEWVVFQNKGNIQAQVKGTELPLGRPVWIKDRRRPYYIGNLKKKTPTPTP